MVETNTLEIVSNRPQETDEKMYTDHDPDFDDKETRGSRSLGIIDQSLAFKMGLVSLARFGALGDFLRWVRS